MEKWLSIIVPIYNASRYLPTCLDSLVNQDFPLDKYEIILYDDGSSDSSLQIMKRYASEYSNIHIFTHPNVGVSQTRNCAIDIAKGEYIWFVDADDAIVTNILPVLYAVLSKESFDVLVLGYKTFDEDLDSMEVQQPFLPVTSVDSGMRFYMNTNFATYTWNRLIRRGLLNEWGIRFVPDIIAEDLEMNIRCYYFAKRVAYFPMLSYWYRMRRESLSQAKQNVCILVESILAILGYRVAFMKNHPHRTFWGHVLVRDMRKLHYFVSVSEMEKKDIKQVFESERKLMYEALPYLSMRTPLNFCLISVASISPIFLFRIQKMVRHFKNLILR